MTDQRHNEAAQRICSYGIAVDMGKLNSIRPSDDRRGQKLANWLESIRQGLDAEGIYRDEVCRNQAFPFPQMRRLHNHQREASKIFRARKGFVFYNLELYEAEYRFMLQGCPGAEQLFKLMSKPGYSLRDELVKLTGLDRRLAACTLLSFLYGKVWDWTVLRKHGFTNEDALAAVPRVRANMEAMLPGFSDWVESENSRTRVHRARHSQFGHLWESACCCADLADLRTLRWNTVYANIDTIVIEAVPGLDYQSISSGFTVAKGDIPYQVRVTESTFLGGDPPTPRNKWSFLRSTSS